ncbi:serine proteinase [Thelephora ganbajun]|uniref:Serine proteinase n=1 Tax=Thelephora ganbajun TaxID=370292 RepID=A0ACB6Z384_THEGA|nr:serine proteinase [Thelephora ganbajun]
MFSKNLVILALCVLPTFSAPSPLIKVHKAREPVAGRYIVTLKEGTDRQAHINSFSAKADGSSSITHQWDIINGFAGTFSPDEVEALRSRPDVLSIEEDGVVHTQDTATQNNAPWGLGRISSQNTLANQDTSALSFSYTYDSTAGSGATVYVIDTGIYTAHSAFGGRARWGATFGGYPDADGNGHGTHVAGTAVSDAYGVAKSANIVAIKVLSDEGSGTNTDVISGIDWVANNHASGPSVASLSLGGGASTAVDTAITNLIKSGVTTVVAAGNENADANNSSPARVRTAITVGAAAIDDSKASFSNYGDVLAIWAPGVNVISTWNNGGINSISGTSMATPHVSGFSAYLLGLDSSLTPSSVKSTIQSKALNGALSGIPSGTINLLLNNGLSS